MTGTRIRPKRCVAALLAYVAAPAFAQPANPSPFSGSASLGVRSVEVAGTETKFREDLNLADGVRLFDAHFRYEPARAADPGIDRLELDASGLGGDPYESIHFNVRKYGAFNLKLDRRQSDYFYEDTILPAAIASIPGATGGDFHHFDFQRIRDTAALDIDVSPATQVSVGLERQTREGTSTTTLGIERDEFELARPLDESMNALTIGLKHAWDRVTLVVAEELHDFQNSSELFLPGASEGRNPADSAELQFFMRDQSYDYTSRAHAVRILATPTARLDVKAGWRREDLDLDMRASEQSAGTTFTGVPFTTALEGPAAVGRNIEIADVGAGFKINERIRIIGNARRSTLAQTGDLAFGTDLGTSTWDIATDGWEVGVETALSAAIVVAAGWSTENRATDYDWALNTTTGLGNADTRRDGYFARLALHATHGLELTASIEDNDIEDPFALATPTSSRRYKVTAKRHWNSGLTINGSYRKTDLDNDAAGWLADTNQADLRVLYQRERLRVSAGYSRIDLARDIEQLVTAGTAQNLYSIAYDAESALWDTSARWQINARYAVGAELRSYENHGSFRLMRDEWRAFLDVAVGADYSLRIAYRDLNYIEDAYDAYDAQILEVALGLHW